MAVEEPESSTSSLADAFRTGSELLFAVPRAVLGMFGARLPDDEAALADGWSPWYDPLPRDGGRYSDALLEPLRLRGDPVTDDMVAGIGDPAAVGELLRTLKADPYLVPGSHTREVRDWADSIRNGLARVDRVRYRRGTELFARQPFLTAVIFGTSSLLESYACRRGARVLARASDLKSHPYRRLTETLQWVMYVEQPVWDAPDDRAVNAILKVRLMHGCIRYLLTQPGQPWYEQGRPIGDPGRRMEVPLNEEDLLGTLMAFAAIPLRDLPKFGISIDRAEAWDHLYVWNVVGLLLGINRLLLPRSVREARYLVESIKRRHQEPSTDGRRLTWWLVRFHRQLLGPDRDPILATAVMRRLVGPYIADMLGVPRSPLGPVVWWFVRLFHDYAQHWGALWLQQRGIAIDDQQISGYTVPAAYGEYWDLYHPGWRRPFS